MRRLFPWSLLVCALALIILVVRHSGGMPGALSRNDTASLIYMVGLIVLIGGAVLTIFRQNLSRALASVMYWVAIALLLVLGYTYRFEVYDIADRVMVELVPGRTLTRGHTVEVARTSSGDFKIATDVNGVRVPMVLDTGASTVVLTHDAAKAAGLPLEFLKYTVNVETANGHALAASVTLDRVGVGGIVERSVPALIAQPGQLKTSLLGMSFLNRLQSWEVRGTKVMMRGYP